MEDTQRAQRRALAGRKRRIILNNDGNEPVYLSQAPTADEILRHRTAPFLGSQVDTVFYCTWCSGFGLFTHLTDVGQIFDTTEEMFSRNLMSEFADKGVDPLAVMNGFCHDHGIEFFWSMRMNDTHDGHGAAYSPVMLRANDLKTRHPEYMIGTEALQVRYGNWTAMDFAREEIRVLAYSYVEEVCRNYDVDGIELDFFRHPVYFHGPARGFAADAAERSMMSDLVRSIRLMLDAEGEKRGRPFLLAIRAPDSVEYCRAIGLDLETWFAEDLVDLFIPGGYIRLNPWESSVSLGHRYGVRVYPALDESRVPEEGSDDVTAGTFARPRSRYETYRARAAEVWASGADGVYLYNYFDPESPLLSELGDSRLLSSLDRDCYASYLGAGRIAGDGYPHEPYMSIPSLNPLAPIAIYPGETESVGIGVFDGNAPGAELSLGFREPPESVERLTVSVGGVRCAPLELRGESVVCKVPPEQRRRDRITVEVGNGTEVALTLTDCLIRLRG